MIPSIKILSSRTNIVVKLSLLSAGILILRFVRDYSFHIIQKHYILRLLNNHLKTNDIFFFDANKLK